MVALVSKECGDTISSTKNIIVGKLCKREELRLVTLIVAIIYIEILF